MRGAGVVAVVAVLLGATTASAAPSSATAACVAANEQAGPLRRAGKLRESRAQLRLCSADTCPAVVRKDCIAGAAQADADIPTIVFSVQDNKGNDLGDVAVSLDGQQIAEKLDGKALEVDPGEHVFRFSALGQPTVEKKVVVVEGEKNRREKVMLGEPLAPPPVPVVRAPVAPPPPPPNRQRTIGLWVGGAGLVSLAVGGAAGLVAAVEWSNVKNVCGTSFPGSCADIPAAKSERNTTLAAGDIADVALGLGAAALVTGAVLVLIAPTRTSKEAALSVAPDVTGRGLLLRGSF